MTTPFFLRTVALCVLVALLLLPRSQPQTPRYSIPLSGQAVQGFHPTADTLPNDLRPTVWKPRPYPGTGPYRRVYSTIPASPRASGFAYTSAWVSLNGRESLQTDDAAGCTGYVYLGGWGGTGGGGAVDAGFQYSSTHNNWAVFVARIVNGRREFWACENRLAANQRVFVSFSVPHENVIRLAWRNEAGTEVGEVDLEVDPAGGWHPDGAGCVLKRMTTLGQKPERLDADYWSANVAWTDCRIGTSEADALPWTNETQGGAENYPANSPKVTTTVATPAEETVTIDLRR